jgi:predicted double-glycine peptidase
MNLWPALFVSLLCSFLGVVLGRWFSRQKAPYWTFGYFIPLVFVFICAAAFRFPDVMFTPPFSWMTMGIKKFAAFGFFATMLLTTPLSRVPQKRNRALISFLMVVIVFFMAIWPFIAPMVDRKELSQLQTKIDSNGVCLQSTDYTCGPASAVTALRKLGFPAEEGQIAILSCTSFQEGTPLDMLADGLNRQYAANGLSVNCRVFHDISDLKQAGLTLAIIKYGLFVDHWVTVLGVTDSEVIVGDPLGGLDHLSYQQFAKKWRFIGIVLKRTTPP